MTGTIRVVQRNALVYRRAWRASLFSSFLQPSLFLLSMGVGVGALVDQEQPLPGGVDYLAFLAPGLLAAACMQTAAFESCYPIMGKFTWRRNYEAIAATPVRTADLVFGELLWLAARLSMVAVAFTTVITIAGVPRTPLVVLAAPVAVLTGLAFSAPLLAYSATIKHDNAFNVVFRFIITPLFLFSGVFFPLARLPDALEAIVWFTPLYHGVELVRGLTLGTVESPAWVIHLGYLATLLAVGTVVALRAFERRLRA